MTHSNFKPGQLIRRIHKLTGRESDWDCFLVLFYHRGEAKPYVGSQGKRDPGFYEVLTPNGTKDLKSNASGVWEVVS